jgi:hypothetical protein
MVSRASIKANVFQFTHCRVARHGSIQDAFGGLAVVFRQRCHNFLDDLDGVVSGAMSAAVSLARISAGNVYLHRGLLEILSRDANLIVVRLAPNGPNGGDSDGHFSGPADETVLGGSADMMAAITSLSSVSMWFRSMVMSQATMFVPSVKWRLFCQARTKVS